MGSTLVGSSRIDCSDDFVFIEFDGGSQTPGGTTIAMSIPHARVLARRILEEASP